MKKEEFLAAMEKQLLRLPKAERDDILSDYEAHYSKGAEYGRSEEEVSASLGDPIVLAATYLENLPTGAKGAQYIPPQGADNETKYAEDGAKSQPSENQKTTAIVVVVLLSVFVAAPVVSGLVSAWFSIIAVVVALLTASFALLAATPAAIAASGVAGVGTLLLGIALAALTALVIVGMVAAVNGIVWLIKWYVGVCKKMIKEGI